MTAAILSLEQRLVRAYRDQLRQYDQALAIMEQQAPQTAETLENAAWVHDLHATLDAVALMDAGLAEDKSAWRASGQTPGPELKELLDCLAERIRTLSACINRHVFDIQARKQQVVPEIDEFIQQRRMLRAYGTCR